jgi:hypothetical protein
MFTAIMEIFALIAHLVTALVRVALPGGVRAVIAESLLLKHQLLILNRSRSRAPRLTPCARLLFGVGAFLVAPNRLPKIAIGIRPSTLLRFHRALIQGKYRLLFTPRVRQRPGPKGPALEGTHRSDPRNEAPQSALRLSAHCATDGSCVRRRDRQGRRASHPRSALPTSLRNRGTILALAHRRYEGRPPVEQFSSQIGNGTRRRSLAGCCSESRRTSRCCRRANAGRSH